MNLVKTWEIRMHMRNKIHIWHVRSKK